jgi:hypothetical protein
MCEEELVDYDEDPAIAGKIEMAKLEKKIESRAQMLMDRVAVNIPMEVPINVGERKLKKLAQLQVHMKKLTGIMCGLIRENHLFQQSPKIRRVAK